MLIQFIWAVIATGISGALFWYAREDAQRSYGIGSFWIWAPAWVFALCAGALWIWLLSSLVPLGHMLYWLAVGMLGVALVSWSPAVNGQPRWADKYIDDEWWVPIWMTSAILSYAALLASASVGYWMS